MQGGRVFVALLLVAISAWASQPEAADGIARRFVEAINTDDAAKRREHLSAVFSASTIESVGIEKLASQAAGVRERFGILELHHGEISTVGSGAAKRSALHVFARAGKADRWQDFQFRLDEGVPPRATQLIFIAEVTEPIALPNGEIASTETLEWLSGYVERLRRDNSFSGAIVIASGDQVIFERIVGVSDAAGVKKNDASTRFNMASGGKMFTAVALAKLVEAGKLDWSTPLLEAVEEFPESPRARTVTIHHLLTHTSGIGEYWTDDFEKARAKISSTADMLPWVVKAGFAADPGASVAYSNSNFVLAGLAIEKASGMSFEAFLAKTIFEPLGMKNTGYPLITEPGLAAPLVRKDDQWVAAPQGLRGSAAGGSYSTPADLLRFVRALLSGKLVQPETLKLLTTSKTSAFADGFEYGYGFAVHQYKGTMSFGHGGIAQGVDFDLEHFPRRNLTIIVFGNRGAPAFDSLRTNATRLITGER